VRKLLKETVPTVSHNLVASLFRLLDSLLEGAGYKRSQQGAQANGGYGCITHCLPPGTPLLRGRQSGARDAACSSLCGWKLPHVQSARAAYYKPLLRSPRCREPAGGSHNHSEESAAPAAVLPALFTFALTWSLGASCNKDGRAAFDQHLRGALDALTQRAAEFPAAAAILDGAGVAAAPPAEADLYEWVYEPAADLEGGGGGTAANGRGWVRWMDTAAGDYKCDPDRRFNQIVVPTIDTVRRASACRRPAYQQLLGIKRRS
jgi:hypothetical protein